MQQVKPIRCKFCNDWITFIEKDGKRVPYDVSWDDNRNYATEKHACKPVTANEIDPDYVYPADIFKTLVKDEGRWKYLGTVVSFMSRRRKDKEIMSSNNFKKNYGHRS